MYTAHHIDWTKPSRGKIYLDGDIEMLVAVYSVLKWQKHNGKVILHTDKAGYEEYKKTGLLELWDDVETAILDNFDFSYINYKSFWAVGKMAVLSKIELPGFIMDLDMVVMDDLSITSFDSKSDISFHNKENIFMPALKDYYLDYNSLIIPGDYKFPDDLDWKECASTCNFYYMNNEKLRDEYIKESFRFMRKNPTNRMVEEILFAEQRLLRMLVKKGGYKLNRMLDRVEYHNYIGYWDLIDPGAKIDLSRDRFLIHLGTSVKSSYSDRRQVLCRHLIKRIFLEFPEVFEKLAKIEVLQESLRGYF